MSGITVEEQILMRAARCTKEGRGGVAGTCTDYDGIETEGGTVINTMGRCHPEGSFCNYFCVIAWMGHGRTREWERESVMLWGKSSDLTAGNL